MIQPIGKPLYVAIPAAKGGSAKILDRAGQEVAEVRAASFGQALANAKMFAASPDLLDACRRARKELQDGGEPTVGLLEDLQLAIQFAEGVDEL